MCLTKIFLYQKVTFKQALRRKQSKRASSIQPAMILHILPASIQALALKKFQNKNSKRPETDLLEKQFHIKPELLRDPPRPGTDCPQTVYEQPKKYLRLAVAGILITIIIFISMIWLWPESDKDRKVAHRSEEPAANNRGDVSTRPPDLPQHLLADDTSKVITDTVDVLEDKDDEITKSEKPADTYLIAQETEEINTGAVEDNTDLPQPEESKEVLRIETDDFTLTIERPKSKKNRADISTRAEVESGK